MKRKLCLHLATTIFVVCLFLKAFFPMKNVSKRLEPYKINPIDSDQLIDGHKQLPISVDPLSSVHGNDTLTPLPYSFKFKRLVVMVIDALREDFAYGPFQYMPLTHSLFNSYKGLKYTATVMPPTVTLPRIKALVTGSSSSFADVVLNFGSSVLEEDNLINELHKDGQKIVFYGDDTWLKLFPKHFLRSEGTTSFFVSDYTEVDNNVTRHLPSELTNPDWDMMILHYLGLDHIGHFAGPNSPLIRPKLAEMDQVIMQIFRAMEKSEEHSLLVVCGDHGMSDQGGHGGASPAEINVPVMFLSPQFNVKDSKHHGTIAQTDLCPTISALMGVPVPGNNIGRVVVDVLKDYSLLDKVTVLHHNTRQAMKVLQECVGDIQKESAYMLHKKAVSKFSAWSKLRNQSRTSKWQREGEAILAAYSESLSLISEKVSKLSTQYDVYAMAISIVLMWMVLISLAFTLMQAEERGMTSRKENTCLASHLRMIMPVVGSAILSHIIMCTGSVPSDLVCSATSEGILIQGLIAAVFIGLALNIFLTVPSIHSISTIIKTWKEKSNAVELLLLLGCVVHTFSLVASSLVEEEHQTFFFLAISLHILIFLQLIAKYFESSNNYLLLNDAKKSLTSKETYDEHDRSPFVEKDEPFSLDDSDKFYSGSEYLQDNFNVKEDNMHNISGPQQKQLKKTIMTEIPPACSTEIGRSSKQAKASSHEPRLITRGSVVHGGFSILLVMGMIRLSRRINHTGNKWLDIPDFGDWLVLPENKGILSMMCVFSLMIIGASRGKHMKRVQMMTTNLALLYTYLSHAGQGKLVFPIPNIISKSGVIEARIAYFFIAITFFLSLLPENFLRLEETASNRQLDNSKSPPRIKSRPKASTSNHFIKGTSHDDFTHEFTNVENSTHSSVSSRPTNTGKVSTQNSSKLKERSSSVMNKSTTKRTATDSSIEDEEQFTSQQRIRGMLASVICYMCLTKQPHNAPISAILSLAEQIMIPLLVDIETKPVYALLYCVWMGNTFFFVQGNSNSLSTVDVSAGYVGLDGYWPEVTGALLFLTTYSSHLFWSVAFIGFLFLHRDKLPRRVNMSQVIERCCAVLLLTRVLPLSVYTPLVAAQRYHLFVWSVFSPKLLYEATNTLAVALQIGMLMALNIFTSNTS